jgi:hypothetical protein
MREQPSSVAAPTLVVRMSATGAIAICVLSPSAPLVAFWLASAAHEKWLSWLGWLLCGLVAATIAATVRKFVNGTPNYVLDAEGVTIWHPNPERIYWSEVERAVIIPADFARGGSGPRAVGLVLRNETATNLRLAVLIPEARRPNRHWFFSPVRLTSFQTSTQFGTVRDFVQRHVAVVTNGIER